MKFKYIQMKPRALEESLRGKGEDLKFGVCHHCKKIYNKENNRKLCTNCGLNIMDKPDDQNWPF